MTTPFRVPSLPDVPTMDQAGLKGYEATQYFAVAAPKGVPDAVVSRLNAAILKAASAPEVRHALDAGGQVASTMSPAEAQASVQKSLAKFTEVARQAQITLN